MYANDILGCSADPTYSSQRLTNLTSLVSFALIMTYELNYSEENVHINKTITESTIVLYHDNNYQKQQNSSINNTVAHIKQKKIALG